MPTDLELLAVEIDTLWSRDARGRLTAVRDPGNERPVPHAVIATARGGLLLAVGDRVPDVLADELQSVIVAAAPVPDPGTPPPALARCQQILESSLGPLERTSGPSYLIPPGTSYPARARIQRSSNVEHTHLREHNPPAANWSDHEWRLLLAGLLGPWAMATTGDRIIAICHSARLAERGAEAGVWTDPAFRGQGHAAAVTAAWASLLEGSRRHLFYSTAADNRSSQRVAARLNLHPIGWIWRLAPSGAA